jgi:outer membrane protein TolC
MSSRKIPAAAVVLLLLVYPGTLKAGDLSLDFAGAGSMATTASEELRNQYQQHYLRERSWIWSLRSYFPRFSITVSEDDRLSQVAADSFVKNYSLSLDQLLWDGGRTSMSRKLERAGLNLETEDLRRAAQDIAGDAAAAYRMVLLCRKVLDIRKKTLESLEEQKRILSREAELGLVLPMDLAGAEITVSEARMEIRLLELDLIEAEKQLAETLGLEEVPELSEEVDIRRSRRQPRPEAARSLAEARNPDLNAARQSVARRQIEAKYAAFSWVPTVRLNGSAGLSGRQYPLNRYNWSVGITVEFSSPWLSGSLNGSTGWEPPYDRSARLQNSLSPLPDPAQSYSAKNTRLALNLEKSNYDAAFKRIGRLAEQGALKCGLLEKKRALAVEALDLEAERYRLAELKLELGKLTRLELMDARLDCAAKEIAAVETAMSLLDAEAALERILDLPPGGLPTLANL